MFRLRLSSVIPSNRLHPRLRQPNFISQKHINNHLAHYHRPGYRTMSTTAAPITDKYQFMIYAPDKTDSAALQRRLSVRERHLDRSKSLKETGVLKLGRALLSPESVASSGAEQKMVGSLMVIESPSLEEARKVIESDIYYTSGVWDPERIVILPFAGESRRQEYAPTSFVK